MHSRITEEQTVGEEGPRQGLSGECVAFLKRIGTKYTDVDTETVKIIAFVSWGV